MHVHELRRKVTSNTHVRSSSGSSNDTHSRVEFSGLRFLPTRRKLVRHRAELAPQLARGEEPLPELAHHHALVGRVDAIAGEPHTEEENRRVEHAPERFLRSAAALARE